MHEAALATEEHVVGIDPSAAMLRIAAELTESSLAHRRIEFLDGSAESIPLDADTVTIAVAINTIHHWYDLGRGLSEVVRVLAPGGRLIIAEELLPSGGFGHGQGPASDPEHVARAMRAVGFSDVAVATFRRGSERIRYIRGTNAKGLTRAGCCEEQTS